MSAKYDRRAAYHSCCQHFIRLIFCANLAIIANPFTLFASYFFAINFTLAFAGFPGSKKIWVRFFPEFYIFKKLPFLLISVLSLCKQFRQEFLFFSEGERRKEIKSFSFQKKRKLSVFKVKFYKVFSFIHQPLINFFLRHTQLSSLRHTIINFFSLFWNVR